MTKCQDKEEVGIELILCKASKLRHVAIRVLKLGREQENGSKSHDISSPVAKLSKGPLVCGTPTFVQFEFVS